MHQARYDPKSSSGDRGIVESIYPKPVRVIFSPKALKDRVIGTEGNFFRGGFVVDVIIDTVGGKPMLYKVTAVHEALGGEEEELT